MLSCGHQDSSREVSAGVGQIAARPLVAQTDDPRGWPSNDRETVPSEVEQDVLLSYFAETTENPWPEKRREETELIPVPMTPPGERPVVNDVVEPDPLSMTALQQLVAADGRVGDWDHLERTWLKRRRVRRSERLLLNAALSVTAVLISGAFAFVKLEDSVASSRHEANLQWLMARNERRAAIEAENRVVLETASHALTQPKWTGLLSHVKDGRRLLSEIRDHFSKWSYAPFHDPELGIVKREEDNHGGVRVSVRVDGSKPWASTIVMQKVDGVFKLDWPSFQKRFDQGDGRLLTQERELANNRPLKESGDAAAPRPIIGGDAYFSTAPSLTLDQDLSNLRRSGIAYLGATDGLFE